MWYVVAFERVYGGFQTVCKSAIATEQVAQELGRSELERGRFQVRIFWNDEPDSHSLGLGSD